MKKKHESDFNVSALSPATLSYLNAAGWTTKRSVSTSLYEDAYAAERLSLLPEAKNFLRRFGGLIIKYVTPRQQQDVLEFLAERAVRGMGNGGNEGFEELTGVAPLCPIGHCYFGTCILFMDANGRVFGGSDETVSLIGPTGEEAIGRILSGVECKVIEPKFAS
jgi:hypothetical protein